MIRSAMRNYFETRADDLNIPYTHSTEDADLAALVLAQEQQDLLTLPKDKRPNCYGLYWEATDNEQCQGCQIQAACLHRFSVKALPDKAASQATHDPARLAKVLYVTEPAVAFAQAFVALIQNAPQKVGVPSPPEHEQPQKIGRKKAKKSTRLANMSKQRTSAPPPLAPEGDVSDAAVAKLATVVKALAKAASGKPKASKTPKRKSSKRLTSSRKTSAASATAAAPPSAASSAGAVKAPAASSPPTTPSTRRPPKRVTTPAKGTRSTRAVKEPWGEHTFLNRWLRERKNFPMLELIAPGKSIRRLFRDQVIEVRVRPGFYEFQGRKFPTLYQIVKEVTGGRDYPKAPDKKGLRKPGQRRMANWSAPRFFRVAVREAAGC